MDGLAMLDELAAAMRRLAAVGAWVVGICGHVSGCAGWVRGVGWDVHKAGGVHLPTPIFILLNTRYDWQGLIPQHPMNIFI